MRSIGYVLMSALTAISVMAAGAVLTGGIAAAAEDEMAAPRSKKSKPVQAAKPASQDVAQGEPTPQTRPVSNDGEPGPRRGKKRGLPSATESEND
jgi:hypothetical protein